MFLRIVRILTSSCLLLVTLSCQGIRCGCAFADSPLALTTTSSSRRNGRASIVEVAETTVSPPLSTTIKTFGRSLTSSSSLSATAESATNSLKTGDSKYILWQSVLQTSLLRSLRSTRRKGTALSSSTVRGGGSATNVVELPASVPILPTLKQYRQFAIPCLALWVAGPLLSLVDTTFIGLSGDGAQSVRQLAALGPATTFFDGATYLFAFLNVATTNLYSSARAQAGEKSDKAEAVVRTSARVSIRCGIGIMLFLFAFCRPLLKLYIGPKAVATPGLLDSACDYIYIRALSMPTSLLLGVLQASLLGAKDSVTPLVAIMYSTIVNFFGDFLLVSVFPLGLRGAAIATTLAQWAGTAALIPAARKRLVRNGDLGFFNKGPQNKDSVSAKSFLGFAAPVLTLILGKLAAFGFMTHVAAAVPGQPTPLASHQIILSLLFFCSPFFEVISQTAQTFLPAFTAPVRAYTDSMLSNDSKYDSNRDPKIEPWLQAGRTVATSLLGIALASAGCVASVASLIPASFGHFITSDLTVQNALKPLAKFLWLGGFMWAPVAVSEGVLLARLELKFLATIYLLSTLFLPPALMKIKHNPSGTVGQVWFCFVVFQSFRAFSFMARIWGGYGREMLLRLASKSSKRNLQTIKGGSADLTSTANFGSSNVNNIQPEVLPPSNNNVSGVLPSTNLGSHDDTNSSFSNNTPPLQATPPSV